MRRGFAVVLATGAALLAGASAAPGAFHLMKVDEVSAGASADASFVELQMIADGQGLVSGHTVSVYDGSGNLERTFTFPTSVANGNNQRTILIADTAGPSSPDFTWAEMNLAALSSGAVCFDDGQPPDCIAWGTEFTGNALLPGPDTAPFGGPLPTTTSLTRKIFRGCNTLLDDADDRNSATDYSTATPSPQPNSVPAEGSACPNTQISKKPKAKTRDRTPRFEFSGGDGFFCSLDGSKLEQCDSGVYKPGKVSRGKHQFEVTATEADGSIDGTPAKYSWKIVKK